MLCLSPRPRGVGGEALSHPELLSFILEGSLRVYAVVASTCPSHTTLKSYPPYQGLC